jgi:hypothetical protein
MTAGVIALFTWLLTRKGGAISQDDAAVYSDEFERMQDA